jgi:hypothetical protein
MKYTIQVSGTTKYELEKGAKEAIGSIFRYPFGTRFRTQYGEEYILAQIAPNKVNLICLSTGNRYSDENSEKLVISTPGYLSEEEFNILTKNTNKTQFFLLEE